MSSPERLVQSLLIQLRNFSPTTSHDSSLHISDHDSLTTSLIKDTGAETVDQVRVHSSTEIGSSLYCAHNGLGYNAGPSSPSVKSIASFQDALEGITNMISEMHRDVYVIPDAEDGAPENA